MKKKKYIGRFIDIETNETLYTTVLPDESLIIISAAMFALCAKNYKDTYQEVGSEGFRIELKEWNKQLTK